MSSVLADSQSINHSNIILFNDLPLRFQDSLILGNLEQVKAAIAAGADVNQALPNGEMPLDIAMRLNYQEVVSLLQERGAVQTDSKVKFFMKWMGLDLLMTTATVAANATSTSAGVCIHDYMPNRLENFINPHNMIHENIRDSVTKNMFLKVAVIAPVIEEVEYRLLIQEVLLKQLPKKILKEFAPGYVDLIDSKIAKISRVLLSSLLFALPHYIAPQYSRYMLPFGTPASEVSVMTCFMGNRVLNAFGGGIILGSIQEITGDVRYSTVAHMLHNFIPALFMPSNF